MSETRFGGAGRRLPLPWYERGYWPHVAIALCYLLLPLTLLGVCWLAFTKDDR